MGKCVTLPELGQRQKSCVCEGECDLTARSIDRHDVRAFCDLQGRSEEGRRPPLVNEDWMELIQMIDAALVLADVRTVTEIARSHNGDFQKARCRAKKVPVWRTHSSEEDGLQGVVGGQGAVG